MKEHVCPWWLGYLLASPLRRFAHDPRKILAPYVHEGMTVLEPGPAMGFFTLDLARLVGPTGRVVAVDVGAKMIERLQRRATKAGLATRVDARLVQSDSMGLDDMAGKVHFTLAFFVVHEFSSAADFFAQAFAASKPGATLLLAEPVGHVGQHLWDAELQAALDAGFELTGTPAIRRSRAALLRAAARPAAVNS